MIRTCCLLLLLFACLCAGLPSQSLQLADGKTLIAQVEDANGDGLRVRRLDNGGTLDLRWDHLTPECALRIKQSFSLAGEELTEVTVKVTELRYSVNGSPTTLIGKIIDDSGSVIVVQQRGTPYRIPRQDLLQMRPIEVPVGQVFTKDEFYNVRLQELVPGDNADRHMLLAEELMKARDYGHALEHLDKAKELANSKDSARLDERLEKVKLYIAAQKERETIDQIQISRARGTQVDFEQGSKLIAQFDKEFPMSKLKPEFEIERKRFSESRTRFFSQAVAIAWRTAIQTLAEKKQIEPGITVAAIKQYAEQKMSDEIAQLVALRFKFEVAEVKALFSGRAKFPKGKQAENFSYGIGSWLLGEQAVLKDTKQGKEQDKDVAASATQKDELARIAKALREAADRRRVAIQGAQGGQAKEQTEQGWFDAAARTERASWLRAYYGEFSGQLTVTSAFTQPCMTCFGQGSISELGQGNKVEKVKCYLCHGTKWLRGFTAY
ncbi:MAG: hypothetical protein WCR59_01610 [Planctomycetota bacterium]|jgi:hypothetical protein